MTEHQNENEIVEPQDESDMADEAFVLIEQPILMKKGNAYTVVGSANLYRFADRTEITAVLNGDAGKLAGEFLTSEMVAALLIGGVLDPEVAENLRKLN